MFLLTVQTGKSGGSLLQQALLLASAGSITGIMPVMFAVFFMMLRSWRSAVHNLSQVGKVLLPASHTVREAGAFHA